jgi:hypothetical protein
MFGRTIETRIVKKPKMAKDTSEPTVPTDNIFDYGLAVEGVVKTGAEWIVKGVLVYKLVDTVCDIAKNRLSK